MTTSAQLLLVPADEEIVAGVDSGTAAPTWGRRALRLALAGSTFVAVGYLGRATIVDKQGLSLIWPALGVAGLWIGSGNQRTRRTDLLALSAATLLVTLTTGATPGRALVFLAINLTQVIVFVGLVRRWIPDLWGFGGTRPIGRLGDLGRLVCAAACSGIVGLTVGAVASALFVGVPNPAMLAVSWGRNCLALTVITTCGLLVGHPLLTSGGPRAAGRTLLRGMKPAGPRRALETAGLLVTTTALTYLVFIETAARPLAFLLLVTSVWAGLRFAPVIVTLHGVVMGAFGIACTLAGHGPFAVIDSVYYRALTAQAFVAMAVLTGLALAFSRDERDRAIARLAEAERITADRARLLDAVLESMNEGVVVLEEGGRVVVRNTAARHLVGLDENASPHLQPAAGYGLFRGDGVQVADEELPGLRALAGEIVPPHDLHVRAPSVPQGRVIEIGAVPLTSDDPSAPRRAMVNLRDVTVDRQHRDTLSSFAGVVAHDLFNPLTIVSGWAEALEDAFAAGTLSAANGLPMVARIHEAATHMRSFIGDLMSYTVARDQSLKLEPVDLTAMVRQLIRLRADGPSAPVIAVADDLRVWADEGLVRQLFDNLLGNAVKYVAPGVRPAVSITGRDSDGWLDLRVTDNGIGIPAGQREEVFENFHRAANRGYHGTGLGLAICRRIVERHGGTITAEEGPNGIGTAFVLKLPVAPPPRLHLHVAAPASQPG